jgi:pimeloyl-ACP methyl ester carboxylesterase
MVFLHGILNSSNVYKALALNESLKKRRNSLLVDIRNHGGSDYHDSMTYREMVEDVIRTMDKLFIEKFTLLGHSIGGKIAMNLATLYPDRLDGLIVLDTIPTDSNDTDFSKQSQEILRKSLEYDVCSKKDKKKVYEDFINIFVKLNIICRVK